ncbi:MAG: class I SAM-dependent methyltransferase [Verrucomicrobiota bacterium]|nr:class I SAM-dependent methyltransferase [Verrucomicrobiota bacterium]
MGIAQTESQYRPNDPVIILGTLAGNKAEELQKEMFHSCNRVEKYAAEFFYKPPTKVLELGSGIGANSRLMARNGAHVTAIDNSRELLQEYSNLSQKEGCPAKNIRLRRGDITTVASYGADFELVIAVDILPYIAPKDLQSTMQKIYACLFDKGTLVGTIFTTKTEPMARLLMGQLGAHFYEGGSDFARDLLENSGFSVEKLEETESGYRFKAVKK